METKVLAAIMKLQAAQIMLSNEGIHSTLTTHIKKHGSIELTTYCKGGSKSATAIQILEAYNFKGAEFKADTYHEGTPDEFNSYTLFAFISDIED